MKGERKKLFYICGIGVVLALMLFVFCVPAQANSNEEETKTWGQKSPEQPEQAETFFTGTTERIKEKAGEVLSSVGSFFNRLGNTLTSWWKEKASPSIISRWDGFIQYFSQTITIK